MTSSLKMISLMRFLSAALLLLLPSLAGAELLHQLDGRAEIFAPLNNLAVELGRTGERVLEVQFIQHPPDDANAALRRAEVEFGP